MKNRSKTLLLALMLPLLAGCSITKVFKPKTPYPGEDPVVKEEDLTVNFYLDYSHSDEPLYSMRWYQLEPLGECPAEAVLTNADAPDELYPEFIGYSEYSSSLDEDHIWNFATDYKQGNILNLYGIWISR